MDPQELRKIIFRWAPPVVILALIGVATAWFLTRHETPQYKATGRVLVLGQVEASALSLTPDEIINTDAALMTQPPLLQRVINDLHLDMSVDQLASEISVNQEPKTELIDVSVTDSDPSRAARIANAVISDFVATASDQSNAAVQQEVNRLQATVSAAKQTVQNDQAAIDAARQAKQSMTSLEAQFNADNARLSQLTTQLTALQGQQQQTGGKPIDVASPAAIPASPLTSHRVTSMALGAFGGILLGIVLALTLQYLDVGLSTEEDVRRKLGLPTLGVIPSYTLGSVLRKKSHQQRADVAGEAYRRLRTNLMFSSLDTPLKSVVITSARAGEGKTRTAANLAGVTAAAGERVLLVDADMRRPMQHRIFGAPMENGISEMLLRASHADVAPLNGRNQTSFPNLALLTAGLIPPNPSELLASKSTAGVLRLLEMQSDLVIIDTPPAQVVTDALSVAAKASGTILVIESGKTNVRQAEQSIEALRKVGANVLGVVLNKARRRALTGYSYYYYYQYKPAATAAGAPARQERVPSTSWTPVGDTRQQVAASKR